MHKEFEVILDNNSLSDYEIFLGKFENYKENKRDIKLTQLLNEDKRIEFVIDVERKISGIFYLEFEKDVIDVNITLNKVVAIIRSFKFILNGNKVERLSINIEILENHLGGEFKSLLESGTEIVIKQLFMEKFVKFYLSRLD